MALPIPLNPVLTSLFRSQGSDMSISPISNGDKQMEQSSLFTSSKFVKTNVCKLSISILVKPLRLASLRTCGSLSDIAKAVPHTILVTKINKFVDVNDITIVRNGSSRGVNHR